MNDSDMMTDILMKKTHYSNKRNATFEDEALSDEIDTFQQLQVRKVIEDLKSYEHLNAMPKQNFYEFEKFLELGKSEFVFWQGCRPNKQKKKR